MRATLKKVDFVAFPCTPPLCNTTTSGLRMSDTFGVRNPSAPPNMSPRPFCSCLSFARAPSVPTTSLVNTMNSDKACFKSGSESLDLSTSRIVTPFPDGCYRSFNLLCRCVAYHFQLLMVTVALHMCTCTFNLLPYAAMNRTLQQISSRSAPQRGCFGARKRPWQALVKHWCASCTLAFTGLTGSSWRCRLIILGVWSGHDQLLSPSQLCLVSPGSRALLATKAFLPIVEMSVALVVVGQTHHLHRGNIEGSTLPTAAAEYMLSGFRSCMQKHRQPSGILLRIFDLFTCCNQALGYISRFQ